jgi:hypothetical protein
MITCLRYGPLEKTRISGGNGIKTVYDLQSYWTSMPAILASLFSSSEWQKYLLQIYTERTVTRWRATLSARRAYYSQSTLLQQETCCQDTN